MVTATMGGAAAAGVLRAPPAVMDTKRFSGTERKNIVVGISASPSATSTTALVLENLLSRVIDANTSVDHIRVRDLSPEALVRGDSADPGIQRCLQLLDGAAAVIFGTPIYKAAYSGLLKIFLDLMPQFGLTGKTVLAVGTGGSIAHALALDYGLRPVLQSMGARHVIQSVLVFSDSMKQDGGRISFDDSMEVAVGEAIHHLRCSMIGDTTDRLLGHPRPERTTPLG